jgi:hypothetical protein
MTEMTKEKVDKLETSSSLIHDEERHCTIPAQCNSSCCVSDRRLGESHIFTLTII